jgi:hypothetical protein
MAKKLFDDNASSPISPLIDVVMNGMGAMFIILMIYLVVMRPGDDTPEPLKFLAEVEPPPAISGQNYVFTFPITGGLGKRQFALTGDLPQELRFDPKTGTLYGIPRLEPSAKPSASRDFLLQVDVQDGSQRDARSATLRLYPGALPYDPARMPLEIVAETLPPGRVGAAYEAVLGAIGGVEPYTWRVGKASVPKGLDLHNHGRLVGTPEQAGSFRIEVEVSHTRGTFTYQGQRYEWAAAAQRRVYHLEIAESLQHAVHLPVGRVGEPYLGVVLTNGRLPGERVHWTGEVPGLRPSDHEGALRGTPSTAGVFPVAYQISAGATQLGIGAGELRILPKRPEPRVLPAVFYSRVGESVRVAIPYQGMIEPVSITALQPLPKGLQIVDGWLVGTPEQSGVPLIPIKIEDVLGNSSTGEVTLHIRPLRVPLQLDIPETVDAVVGQVVHIQPSLTGGEGDYGWELDGQLPPTLALSPSGAVTGTLSTPGSWHLKITVHDRATGDTAARHLTMRGRYADDTKPRFVTTTVPAALVARPFAFAFATAGGVGEPRFRFQGTLPDGLTFTETGVTGVPTRAEVATFEVTVIDAVGQQDSPQPFKMVVERVLELTPPRVVTHELPPAVPGLAYPQAFAADGGVGPYAWSFQSKLPPGLRVTTQGIDGTVDPLAQGTWPLHITVQDTIGQRATKDILLRIDPGWPALVLEKSALPPAIVGVPYHTRFVAQSCWGDCTWAVTGLPEGLTLTQGVVQGEPHQAGTYPLAVSAKDSRGRQASDTYSLQVTEAPAPPRHPEPETPFIGVLVVLMALPILVIIALGGFWFGKRRSQRVP